MKIQDDLRDFLVMNSGRRTMQTSLIWMEMARQGHAHFDCFSWRMMAASMAATMRLSKWASAAKAMRVTGLKV